MTTRSDYTDEEWTYIIAAPIMAGTYISAVGRDGPIGTMRKTAALALAVGELVHRGCSHEVIGTLIEEINRTDGEALQTRAAIAIDVRTLDALQVATLDALQQAATALSRAKRAEVAEYRALVMSLSQRVAQAGQAGGSLGTAGEWEIRAIQEIGAALAATP
jgi:hypothetical protein